MVFLWSGRRPPEPEKLPVTAYGLFENEEEARKIYGIFKNAMERIPKRAWTWIRASSPGTG